MTIRIERTSAGTWPIWAYISHMGGSGLSTEQLDALEQASQENDLYLKNALDTVTSNKHPGCAGTYWFDGAGVSCEFVAGHAGPHSGRTSSDSTYGRSYVTWSDEDPQDVNKISSSRRY